MKQYSNDLNTTFAEQMSQFISGRRPGQVATNCLVVITREKTTQTGERTSWTAYAIQVSNASANTNQREGDENVDYTNEYDFLFEPTVDIKPSTDKITYTDPVLGGTSKWKVMSTNTTTLGGNIVLSAHCIKTT